MNTLNRWVSNLVNWLFKNNLSNNRKIVLSVFNQNFSKVKDALIEKIPYLKKLNSKDWGKIKNNYCDRLNVLKSSKNKTDCFIDIAIASFCQDTEIADENGKRLDALNELINFILSHPISKKYPKKVRDKILSVIQISETSRLRRIREEQGLE